MSTHTENNYFGCKGSSYALFPFLGTFINAINNT